MKQPGRILGKRLFVSGFWRLLFSVQYVFGEGDLVKTVTKMRHGEEYNGLGRNSKLRRSIFPLSMNFIGRRKQSRGRSNNHTIGNPPPPPHHPSDTTPIHFLMLRNQALSTIHRPRRKLESSSVASPQRNAELSGHHCKPMICHQSRGSCSTCRSDSNILLR